jgi:hypothetical protein
MILNFKRWKEVQGKVSESNYASIFEEEQRGSGSDMNVLLIKLLGNPATRGTVIKRVNQAIDKNLINNTNVNPSTITLDLNKMEPAARVFFDADLPPKIKVKISSLAATEGENKGAGILNVFNTKKKLSEGWVGLDVNYLVDIEIDEVILNAMFENPEDRSIKNISGVGILRGKLVQSGEMSEAGEPKWINRWELIDLGINFVKPLDEYKFTCKSRPATELIGKNLSSGAAIDAESIINVNEFVLNKGEKKIYGPSYFMTSELFKGTELKIEVDINDLLEK